MTPISLWWGDLVRRNGRGKTRVKCMKMVRDTGNKPMSIIWRLQHPAIAQTVQTGSGLR